jgi:rhodanese-related sulfurtransferase
LGAIHLDVRDHNNRFRSIFLSFTRLSEVVLGEQHETPKLNGIKGLVVEMFVIKIFGTLDGILQSDILQERKSHLPSPYAKPQDANVVALCRSTQRQSNAAAERSLAAVDGIVVEINDCAYRNIPLGCHLRGFVGFVVY